ncbi:hypothetical protein CCACVL1_05888 [Corchorus capsularis]|uniref:Uncharacterized protein n=1 Tax=Corchorus capsularis TaxID=210143 RepID=A0A1R3JIJ1_COCAP|nr:hypothetical protein CCACVL1_05888 [Corchorus capsularis]
MADCSIGKNQRMYHRVAAMVYRIGVLPDFRLAPKFSDLSFSLP